MTEPPRTNARAVRHAELLFPVIGLLGWVFFYLIFRQTPGQDWMVFDTAVQAWRRGDLGLLLDGTRFTAVLNQSHAAYLAAKLVFHPWVYPPYTLLLALPFAWLSWPVSYIGFQCISLAGLLFAMRQWCPGGRSSWLFILGILLCPATAFTLGAGQNSFFTAALVVAGIGFLDTRPLAAGCLLGLLAFKPQLAILVPVALVAAGAWQSIATATATVLILLVASLAVPGIELWRAWLDLFLGGDPAFQTWVNEGRLHGQSVFTCLHLLGLPDRLANFGQMIAALLAGITVWLSFRSKMPPAEKLAVLLCGMIFAAAHVGNYDALLQGIAAMLVLTQGLVRPFRPGEAMLAMLVWSVTAVSPPFLFHISVVTPLLLLGLMIRLYVGRPPAIQIRA